MDTVITELRNSARMLINRPAFTIMSVATLALAIGANTAIFSVVNGVLLRPLPFKDSERLVLVWNKGAEAAGGDRTPLAVADLLDWGAQNHTFESVAAYQQGTFNYSSGGVAEQVRGLGITANFLSVMGVGVQVGRGFDPSDEQVGAPRVVLLSDRFWRRHFNGDKQVVGQTVSLNGIPTTVVGVLPSGVSFPNRETDLWRALQLQPPSRRGPYFLTGVGRLKQGVSLDGARADTALIKPRFESGNLSFNILPIDEFFVGEVRPALIALFVAVILVLLIAAVNVANLSLVHAASRLKEISIRAALGASRWRIIKRLLTESLLLAIAGGTLGTLLAFWGVSFLLKLAPENLPRLDNIQIDGGVLAFTALITIVTAILFGLAPAVQSSRLNLSATLRDGTRTTEGFGVQRGRSALVIIELALAVMLLSGAGLLVKSLWRLQNVDLGINPDNVLTAQLTLRGERYNEPAQVSDFSERLLAQAKSVPGVKAVALSNSLPPDETDFSSDFAIEGRPRPSEPQIAYFMRVTPDYFSVLGVPLLNGRTFSSFDSSSSPPVTLINETLKRRFFPNEDPIGKRLNFGNDSQPDWNEIVGVVGDVKYNGLTKDVQPALYQPIAQQPTWGISLIVKSDVSDPSNLTSAIRSEVRLIDPDVPLTKIYTMHDRVALATAQARFRTTLIALFAAVAVVLACVGIYGVVSYSVSQRTHEIGIRIALGARTGDVLQMVINRALVLAAVGVALGLAGSFALTGLLSTLLFGVKPTDPATFALTAVTLTVTALVAAYLPARRASRVDPLVALKCE